MKECFWLQAGAIWGFVGVAMGAFGAHGLNDRLTELGQTANYHTAAQYHMYCALAIVAIGLLVLFGRPSAAASAAGWSFLLGSLVFSGSLYLLAVTGAKWLGAITPIGGVAILAGWVALALAAGVSSPR
jgi:uncharacterized membrane protein YgdD (TMEM256/DUF423 family)